MKLDRLFQILRFFFMAVCFACAFVAGFFFMTIKSLAAPKVMLTFDSSEADNGVIYAGGSNPVLTVFEEAGGETFVEIYKDRKQYMTMKVEKKLEYTFDEGEYRILPYTQSGTDRTYPEGYPVSFVYDCTPPSDMDFEVRCACAANDERKGGAFDIYSSGAVSIGIRGRDELSGIDRIYVETGAGVKESDRVVIESELAEDILAWCVDRCGNESEVYVFDKRIMVDNVSPEITVTGGENDRGVTYSVALSDELSGVRDGVVKWNGKAVRRLDLSDQAEPVYRKDIRVSIDDEDVEYGENELEVTCRDLALNDAVYTTTVTRSDANGPGIRLTGVNNGDIVSGTVSPGVQVVDANLDRKSVVVSADRRSVIKGDSHYEFTADDNPVFSEDGSYVLTVYARDRAGNEAEGGLEFTIDNSPPLIRGLSKYDGKVLDSFSVRDDIGEMFEDDTFVQYRLYLNGRDFFEYETVDKPGSYIFEAVATDMAGNTGSGKAEFEIPSADGEEDTEPDSEGYVEEVKAPAVDDRRDDTLIKTGNTTVSSVQRSPDTHDTGNIASQGPAKKRIYLFIFIPVALAVGFVIYFVRSRKAAEREGGVHGRSRDNKAFLGKIGEGDSEHKS